MKTFPFEYGIAGYVAFSGLTIFVDSVSDDIRFAKDLDDPKGITTEQIVSVPIYCSSDRLDPSPHSLSAVPRGVISLINKKDPNGFSPADIEKLEFLSIILGRCHDAVLKVEQLYSMKHVSDSLQKVTLNIDNCLETNKVQFGIVNKQFKQFIDTTNARDKVAASIV